MFHVCQLSHRAECPVRADASPNGQTAQQGKDSLSNPLFCNPQDMSDSDYESNGNGTVGQYIMPVQNLYVAALTALSVAIVIGNVLVLITFGK